MRLMLLQCLSTLSNESADEISSGTKKKLGMEATGTFLARGLVSHATSKAEESTGKKIKHIYR